MHFLIQFEKVKHSKGHKKGLVITFLLNQHFCLNAYILIFPIFMKTNRIRSMVSGKIYVDIWNKSMKFYIVNFIKRITYILIIWCYHKTTISNYEALFVLRFLTMNNLREKGQINPRTIVIGI